MVSFGSHHAHEAPHRDAREEPDDPVERLQHERPAGLGVAEQLARTFLDFDLEIERRQGKTIAEIFGEKGEGHFRQLERALTEELRLMGNMILAPGALIPGQQTYSATLAANDVWQKGRTIPFP